MDHKLLVIKPPYSTFPVGFAYVLSCLEREKVPFDFIDAEFGNGYKRLLKKDIYSAVATGGLIGHFNFFQQVISDVRKFNPKLPVIVGGNITKDIRPDFLIDKIGADFGVVGEAETSLPYLLDELLSDSKDFSAVPGLIYRSNSGGQIKRNPEKRFDLSKNILPAWHHIDTEYYLKVCNLPYWGLRTAMPVLSGRGCVGRCSFCSPSIGSFVARPVEHVIEEIKLLNSKYDFEWFFFINEMLYNSRQEIEAFCQAYKKLSPRKNWVCSLRVDAGTDAEVFRLLKSAGCVGISAGIESGNDKVLKQMCKKTSGEQIRKFFRDAKTAGLSCNGTFLVGNEGETESELKDTIDMVINEEIVCGESLTNAYPGTLIYRNALSRGLIKDEWEYLKNLKFGCDLWDYRWTNRNHINISALSDRDFWETITGQLRRFNSFLLKRFKAKEVTYKIPFGLLVKATGRCPDCGGTASVVSYRTLLGLKGFCRDCFQIVLFDLYELDEFKQHFDFLSAELKEAKDLVVVGAMKEAVSLLRYDYFGFDPAKVKGVVDINAKNSDSHGFIYKPKFGLNELAGIRVDIFLITDDYFQDSELKLRLFYIKKGLPLPKILHLWPDSRRSGMSFVGLAKSIQGGGRFHKLAFLPVLKCFLFYAAMKRIFLKVSISAYPKIVRLKQIKGIRPLLTRWKG